LPGAIPTPHRAARSSSSFGSSCESPLWLLRTMWVTAPRRQDCDCRSEDRNPQSTQNPPRPPSFVVSRRAPFLLTGSLQELIRFWPAASTTVGIREVVAPSDILLPCAGPQRQTPCSRSRFVHCGPGAERR
jgi:hypothetical protein